MRIGLAQLLPTTSHLLCSAFRLLPTAFWPVAIRVNRKNPHRTSAKLNRSLRIGLGNDLHRLEDGRALLLGGVQVPSQKGAVAHSDGDALIHALCDALLGAAGLGDIGQHFPDSSPDWCGASSLTFLTRIRELLEHAGFRIVNLDATVGLERPKLAPHIPKMKENVANALGIRADQISIKAKTGEGVDAVGRWEAVRADAIALLQRIRPTLED